MASGTVDLLENEKWIFTSRPMDQEVTASNYSREKEIIHVKDQVKDGQVLLQTIYCSVDPYQRIQQAASKTWEDPHPTGAVQGSGTVLRVILSNNPKYHEGQILLGYTGWQKYVILDDQQLASTRDLSSL